MLARGTRMHMPIYISRRLALPKPMLTDVSCPAKSAPARIITDEARQLTARAKALNKQAAEMEERIEAHLATGAPDPKEEVLLESRAQLTNT